MLHLLEPGERLLAVEGTGLIDALGVPALPTAVRGAAVVSDRGHGLRLPQPS